MNYTDEDLKTMTLDAALGHLSNDVYGAAALIERLEYAGASPTTPGKVQGNGHHIRQEITHHAQLVLMQRWSSAREVADWCAAHSGHTLARDFLALKGGL